MLEDYISKVCGVCVVGGVGKRLRPFTDEKPKAMLPVGLERRAMLEFVLMPWKKAGIRKYVFCTGYKSEMIESHFGSGDAFGVKIEYSKEEERLETGGAIKNAIDNKKISKKNPIVVFYCDDLVRLNAVEFFKTHIKGLENGFKATIVATNRFRTHYGILETETDDEGIKRVVSFEEKPLIDKNANVGIYCLEPEVLKMIDEQKPPFKFERVILPKLVEKEWLAVFEISWEDWIPINTDKEYEIALKTNLKDFYSKIS
jgi:NDP-sugar pyrophosphorylase family protein